jgi:hypothetical protein
MGTKRKDIWDVGPFASVELCLEVVNVRYGSRSRLVTPHSVFVGQACSRNHNYNSVSHVTRESGHLTRSVDLGYEEKAIDRNPISVSVSQ